MKIVLVEDENKTRNGILHMIRQFTDHQVVGLAENGKEGYELIRKESPDLVISDIRMPVMSGLEMLQKLWDENIRIHAILLTGYSDFEYARTALKLQVTDYLLKPIDVEEFLKTLTAVETRISHTKIQQVSAEQMIVNYMERKEEDREPAGMLLEKLLHISEKTEISLFLFSPRQIFKDRIQELVQCLRELMESLCIENAYVFQLPGEKKAVVLVAGTEKNRGLKSRFTLKVLPELDEIGPCSCVFGKICGIEKLSEELGRMAEKLSFAFSLPDRTIIDQETVDQIHYQELDYPQNTEHSIIRELRNGNMEKIAEYGNRFIREVVEQNGNPEQIREYAIRLIANVFYVAKEIKEYLNQEENMKYFMEMIIRSETKGEVKYQIEKFFHMITQGENEDVLTENGMVMNAVSYIRIHYKEEITLSDVARVCRVTPEYLSRIFYKEMGINFSPFLQNFRISLAKRMLATGDGKVYEVAEAVGFKDQKYFVKVFKKLCGTTPSEYRKEIKT